MKRVLVTNSGGRLGVSFTRALKAAPESIYVIGVDSHKFMLQRSESNEKYLVPRANEEDYTPVLRNVISETNRDLICVQLTPEMLPVSAYRDYLGTQTFLPKHEIFVICDSKMSSYERWRQAGVPVPESMLIYSEGDLRLAFSELGDRLWLRPIRGTGARGSLPIFDFHTAKTWIDMARGWGFFMAAPLLEKETRTWESIWSKGELIAAQSRKRIYWEFRKITPSGNSGLTGAAVITPDPAADEIAIQAIKAIDPEPHGIFTVDMTYDRAVLPYVTELNAGRLASNGAAVFTPLGFNMPSISVKVALGKELGFDPPLVNPLPDGMVSIHGMGVEPVLTDITYVNGFDKELKQRRRFLASSVT